ncbi:aminotransferase [Oharaeibacter diazotrophicus]|uniref:Aspartate/methionine/tyrosine aminotransferase n=1 Tax=Oharaeibacter diazotrophicus TaxID=1920512 RepID=A0A4R6RIC1_9HYPH|nr:aminotransferase [Oharaeibacter diazotrophicus]TDP86301.1 aspartate/methionine/tyrosine aminotransferase [Oharaeibacter diazotrophicus]BBE71756.1 methionine aminotransferase [Pleomorphomonas sp. SM30]GLS78522.1 aminotransferase [Oharaeibacter diazotrophicus]
MKPTNPIFTGLPTTIFEVMSRLAVETGAINLGQGFPDVDGPEEIRRAAADALMAGPNQYPSMMGIPELRRAVAESNRRFHGLDVDWQSEVMVTSGATEAICDSILGLVSPGDEVVLIEPLYDCYLPIVRQAGGIPKLVRIAPPTWTIDPDQLAAAFSDRTKAIVINTPMNPAGKVFTEAELQLIADLCQKHDAYVIADEVYEHLVYDGRRHLSPMALPGMRERVVRIGSAGKTFSLTAWKIGYVTAPPHLLAPIAKVHQFVTFTTPPDLQAAVARGLRLGDDYYEGFAAGLAAKRDRLSAGLADLGFEVLPSAGTYFVTTDVGPLGIADDREACLTMTREAGVAAVPVSAFYASDPPTNYIRFCFCKRDEVLDEALERLGRWLKTGRKSAATG